MGLRTDATSVPLAALKVVDASVFPNPTRRKEALITKNVCGRALYGPYIISTNSGVNPQGTIMAWLCVVQLCASLSAMHKKFKAFTADQAMGHYIGTLLARKEKARHHSLPSLAGG